MTTIRIAIPSMGEGGLEGFRAGHFGHCDVFTCIDAEDGEIKSVTTIQNKEHLNPFAFSIQHPFGLSAPWYKGCIAVPAGRASGRFAGANRSAEADRQEVRTVATRSERLFLR